MLTSKIRESSSEFASVATTKRKACAVSENHDEVTMEMRLHLADSLGIYYGTSVNPDEALGVEAFHHTLHRLSQSVSLLAGVEYYVIAGRLDPINVIRVDKDDSAGRLY